MSTRSAKAGGIVSSKSGWVAHPTAPHVRVEVHQAVEVHVDKPSGELAREVGSGLVAFGGAGLVLGFRGFVGGVSLILWCVVRALECAAAIGCAAERMMGGGRDRLPLLYWRKREPYSALAKYEGD